MAIPTLRPKNQVTIPAALAAQAGISVGDPLQFGVENNKLYISAYAPDQEWITNEIAAEIEEATQEPVGPGFDNADDMIAALRG